MLNCVRNDKVQDLCILNILDGHHLLNCQVNSKC